jgi:hypothetical protein
MLTKSHVPTVQGVSQIRPPTRSATSLTAFVRLMASL